MNGPKKSKPFKYKYTVAWADTDALGIMHFSNYFRLCERAEQSFYESKKLDDNKLFLPRVSASCDFKSPLRFRDIASVSLKVDEIGERHITFSYSIRNQTTKKTAAECKIVVVPVSDKLKPKKMKPGQLKRMVS